MSVAVKEKEKEEEEDQCLEAALQASVETQVGGQVVALLSCPLPPPHSQGLQLVGVSEEEQLRMALELSLNGVCVSSSCILC